LHTSMFFLKKALDIYERSQGLAYIHFTLIEMVDVEIEMAAPKKEGESQEVSGPWMTKLFDHIAERDLPGTAAQAKLLLAKFRFKQGRVKESRKLVDDVLKISERTSMHYLKDKAEILVPDLLLS